MFFNFIINEYGTGFRRIKNWLKDYPEITLEIQDLKDLFKINIISQNFKNLQEITDNDNKVTDDDNKVTDDNNKVTDDDNKVTDDDNKVTDDDNKVTDDNNKVTDKLSQTQFLIIELINQTPEITTNAMSQKIDISQRKIKENIAKLKKMKIVDRIGNTKSGRWKIIK